MRSAVVLDYTLIDEYLNALLCHYFFGKKKSFINLWKAEKFKNFNYYILEKLYLVQNLEFARAIQRGIQGDIANAIFKLNGLRNALAHSFFPENRKQKLPLYGDQSIYTLEGFETYREEVWKISKYFARRLYQ